ncbi:hypothetical protein TPHV1_10348 [Treponema phagedenis]|uniref:Uncharacterized protein n=1 Tax=Treponema phagedenis TaxID=162 RepID=A0A0B7GUP0_TREPH|nr:hypothetical protein TPHV1_10348 [Treponema phagedenis]
MYLFIILVAFYKLSSVKLGFFILVLLLFHFITYMLSHFTSLDSNIGISCMLSSSLLSKMLHELVLSFLHRYLSLSLS